MTSIWSNPSTSSASSSSVEEGVSYAERRLTEIKQQNAEAQRRRRRRIKERGVSSAVVPQENMHKRKQQNAEAQRRRRLKMKDNKLAAGIQDHHKEIIRRNLPLQQQSCYLPESQVVQVGKLEMGHLKVICALLDALPENKRGNGMLITQACKQIFSHMFGPGRDSKEEFSYNHIIADYLRFRRQELDSSRWSLFATGKWSTIPANFVPTHVQVAYPEHPAFIDLLPWPSFRDRLVLHIQDDAIDVVQFCADLLQHPSVTGHPCPFFIFGNDPLLVCSWEISQWFFEKYDYLCDQEMLESTNLQRLVRGEPLLIKSRLMQEVPPINHL